VVVKSIHAQDHDSYLTGIRAFFAHTLIEIILHSFFHVSYDLRLAAEDLHAVSLAAQDRHEAPVITGFKCVGAADDVLGRWKRQVCRYSAIHHAFAVYIAGELLLKAADHAHEKFFHVLYLLHILCIFSRRG